MIVQNRSFEVTYRLLPGKHPDLPAGPNYRCALRPEGVSFKVNTVNGLLDPGPVTVTGCNIRSDGSAGAATSRWFIHREDCPWAFEYVDQALREILKLNWPDLYAVGTEWPVLHSLPATEQI